MPRLPGQDESGERLRKQKEILVEFVTLSIPAAEVRQGDRLDLGGQPFTVRSVDPHPSVERVFYVRGCAHTNEAHNSSTLVVDPDTVFTVQRPDPEAELVETMARALIDEWYEPGVWERRPDGNRETWRSNMRAALAAAREAGLL